MNGILQNENYRLLQTQKVLEMKLYTLLIEKIAIKDELEKIQRERRGFEQKETEWMGIKDW